MFRNVGGYSSTSGLTLMWTVSRICPSFRYEYNLSSTVGDSPSLIARPNVEYRTGELVCGVIGSVLLGTREICRTLLRSDMMLPIIVITRISCPQSAGASKDAKLCVLCAGVAKGVAYRGFAKTQRARTIGPNFRSRPFAR